MRGLPPQIINTSNNKHMCDIMLKRNNKKYILIENKMSVPKCEVNKFVSDYNSSNHENANGYIPESRK